MSKNIFNSGSTYVMKWPVLHHIVSSVQAGS